LSGRRIVLALGLALFAARCRASTPAPTPTPSPTPDPCDLTRGGLDLQRDVVPPRKVKDVTPAYPDAARSGGKTGNVVLEFAITPEGRTADVKVTRGVEPALDQAAVDAVRQWEYTAARVRGAACRSLSRVTIRFLPPPPPSPARPPT